MKHVGLHRDFLNFHKQRNLKARLQADILLLHVNPGGGGHFTVNVTRCESGLRQTNHRIFQRFQTLLHEFQQVSYPCL